MLKKLEEYDLLLMLMAIALTCFGVVMVYSASTIMAAKRFHDGFFFLKRQGLFAVLGFAIMLGVMQIDYHVWKKMAVPALLLCLVLLVLVLIPGIGGKAGGSSRWIKLPGFNLQPSEMAKLALIMYMAYSLDKKQDKVKEFAVGIVPLHGHPGGPDRLPGPAAGPGRCPDPGGGGHDHAVCRRDPPEPHHLHDPAGPAAVDVQAEPGLSQRAHGGLAQPLE